MKARNFYAITVHVLPLQEVGDFYPKHDGYLTAAFAKPFCEFRFNCFIMPVCNLYLILGA
jgi:hypothetical protein